jgi:hypothetical protein
MYKFIALSLFFVLGLSAFAAPRQTVSLNGTWQIAEGKWDAVPDKFERTVPVPGFIDMATPAFEDAFPEFRRNHQGSFKDPKRDAYWYRREFNLDEIPALCRLKIHKAMFGSKVILNGQAIDDQRGEHPGSVTPAYFDVTKNLKKGKNEIIIRVGADLEAAKGKAVWLRDYEKIHYTPGIFDSVELICSGTPYIENIQTAPDVQNGKVRIQVNVVDKITVPATLKLTVKEWKSGKIAGNAGISFPLTQNGRDTIETTIPI